MSVIEALPTGSAKETVDSAPVITFDELWPFSVEQYHHLVHEGYFAEDAPVELLKGRVFLKMPQNPPHILTLDETRDALADCIPTGWFIRTQAPVTTHDSEPEPDIFVVRGARRDYGDHHPGPKDVGLVVEVANTSLQRDRGLKREVYGEALVPVYWVVNLNERRVEVYSAPENGEYSIRLAYAEGDEIPVVLDEKEIGSISVSSILP
jgi:Uma2 family endonuclease